MQSNMWLNGNYYYLCGKTDNMIAEIKFRNMFSFRDEAVLSFEADRSKDMESYHVVESARQTADGQYIFCADKYTQILHAQLTD